MAEKETQQAEVQNEGTASMVSPDVHRANSGAHANRPIEPDIVEVRHRGRLSSLLSMLSCCRRSSLTESAHFHANRVEDVSVVIRCFLACANDTP